MTSTLHFVDFEASAFFGYPIEIGWATLSATGNIESDSLLIHPTDEWLDETDRWSAKAEKVHGISMEKLLTEGLPVEEVCDRVDQVFGNNTVYCRDERYDQRWGSELYQAAMRTMK